jgi:hypothetical protein
MSLEPIRRIGPREDIQPVTRVERRREREEDDGPEDRSEEHSPAPRREPPDDGEHLIDVTA